MSDITSILYELGEDVPLPAAVKQRIAELEQQLAEALEFIDFCQSLTGSMWPQNETTERLAEALRQSPIVKALAGEGGSDVRI